jgi:hypothetical protein
VRPHVAFAKAVLEQRHGLARRRTLFEFVEILISGAQWYLWAAKLVLRNASDYLSWITRWAR